MICGCGEKAAGVAGQSAQTGEAEDAVVEMVRPESSREMKEQFIHPSLTADYYWEKDKHTEQMILYAPDKDSHEHTFETDGHVCTQIEPVYLLPGDHIQIFDCPSYSYSIYFAEFDPETYRYTVIEESDWTDMQNQMIEIQEAVYVMMDYAFADQGTTETDDIDLKADITDKDIEKLERKVFFRRTQDADAYAAVYEGRNRILEEIEVSDSIMETDREGEKTTVDYVMIRIPRQLADGTPVKANVDMTGLLSDEDERASAYSDAQVCRSALSPLLYSMVYPSGITLNAGLFNTGSLLPEGQTVVDGRILTNKPMEDDMGNPIDKDSSCYALMIGEEGKLSTTFERTADAVEMAAEKAEDVVTAWGCFVYNGEKTSDDQFHDIVHGGEYARQVIGVNDEYYIVLTTNMEDKNKGFTYDELAQILIDAGADFAYSLDSGGSTATCVGNEQITTVFEGKYGRRVPTILRFDIDQ